MESEKRKQPDDVLVVDDGKKAKRQDGNGGESVVSEEEEVEEFFAILKRIHVAVRYFEKANYNGGGRKLTLKNEWKPSFLLQDFEGDNDDVKNEEKPEDVEDDSGNFDLNLEPVSKERRTD